MIAGLFCSFFGVCLVAAVIGALVWAMVSGQRAWESVAEDLGFEYSRSILTGRELQGSRRGFHVHVHEKTENKTTRVLVEVHGVDPGFTLGRDSILARLIKPDIQTGDQIFDERTRIEGDAVRALAVLDDETRRLTEIVVTGADGKVEEGQMQSVVAKVQEVPRILESMLDLAERLRRPADRDLPALLALRALDDSAHGVCLTAFRQLMASYYRTEAARETAIRLMESPDATLRLEAGRVLLSDPEVGRRAADVLSELGRSRHLDSATRRTALESLGGSGFRETAVAAMAANLRDRVFEPPEIRRVALRGLVRLGARAELLAVELADDPAEAELLATGLAHVGDASAQPRLLELLDHPEDRVRKAAAQSLGAVGTVAAVAPLRELASSGSLFRSAVARAAESAIAQIQRRAGGSQAGEISLVGVEPLEGAVSPASETGDGGELSLARGSSPGGGENGAR